MRILLAVLIALVSVGAVLAQTPPPASSVVTVALVTGDNGTAGNLTFTLSGTFPGDPLALPLDQPGDLQPGLTNVYSFSVPYGFCEMFQFELRLDGDDWLGEEMTITINGVEVWFNGRFGDSGALTPVNWRGGTWDGTDAYRAACPTLAVDVSFITGVNGTADNPSFYVQGDFSASPYNFYVNQPGDLQPGLTNSYSFRVPMGFCQMTNWRLLKGTTGGIDDDWLPTQISITIDGTEVFFDGAFADLGPILSSSNISGTWDGTEAYQTRCAPGILIDPPQGGAPVREPTINPQAIDPALGVIPPVIVQIQPIIVTMIAPPGGFAQPTLIAPPLQTPEVIDDANPNGGVAQCQGAPPARLEIGGFGRVTPGAPNRLRAQASTSGAILGNMPAGSIFGVIGGPTCGEGYTWWQVNFNGIVGWTV
ncbi:MAG: SH3 domain-containing protein, partial [Chloroflexota bacterium]